MQLRERQAAEFGRVMAKVKSTIATLRSILLLQLWQTQVQVQMLT
jgi:hypothetical protein